MEIAEKHEASLTIKDIYDGNKLSDNLGNYINYDIIMRWLYVNHDIVLFILKQKFSLYAEEELFQAYIAGDSEDMRKCDDIDRREFKEYMKDILK